jgi:hypothetical protein
MVLSVLRYDPAERLLTRISAHKARAPFGAHLVGGKRNGHYIGNRLPNLGCRLVGRRGRVKSLPAGILTANCAFS